MNGMWDWNGPEEGDEIDLAVVIMFDGEEIMQLDGDADDVEERKDMAITVCNLLNAAEWRAIV